MIVRKDKEEDLWISERKENQVLRWEPDHLLMNWRVAPAGGR